MRYCVITYGCQMNKNDSERISTFFDENGLESSLPENAELFIINSCSIRQSAIDRIREKAKKIKSENKKLIITGCLLKEDKKEMQEIADYVLSTKEIFSNPLPFLKKKEENYFQIEPKRNPPTANISIMTGCNNFCSYCVVPYTKGREFSRPKEEIIEEAKKAIEKGCKEIWLLGQNVNSYSGGTSFSNLLYEINKIKGDFWIRFTSSHPKDFSSDLIDTIKSCKKVTNYLNLPVQSGDDEILKKMNRPYTIDQYKKIIYDVKKNIPNITLSTDIIVGFPGEKEKNFHNTVKLINEINFDMIYIGRYSPRPQTEAFKMKNDVSQEEKKRREKIITEILKENNLKKNKTYKGKNVKVLVLKKIKENSFLGKTQCYKTVLIESQDELVGNFVKVKIINYSPWGLKGKISPK